jgi:superfamily II DNA or RNA helicase
MRLYGKLEYKSDGVPWRLTGDAHVLLRARRIFEGAVRRGFEGALEVRVADTRSNCRDLVWLMDRWPLEMSDDDRARLTQAARSYDQANDHLWRLTEGMVSPEDFELAIPAREYQRVGASAWLAQKGLLLADDLGIGKTCTAIAALTRAALRPAVVVTLAPLCGQWQREIAKFAPDLQTHIVKQRKHYDLSVWGVSPDVVIISYPKAHSWVEVLSGAKAVVFDECQELRRDESKKYQACKTLADSAEYRLGLSATPINNYGGEFFNVIDVLRPGELGHRGEFLSQWCTHYHDSIRDPVAFGSWLRANGIMLRRTREDVGIELPQLTKVIHTVNVDRKPLSDVSASCRELARVILDSSTKGRGEAMQASEHFTNLLRQATGIAKAAHVADFVRLLLENGERVVLYGWHREVYRIWLDRLSQFSPALYTGSEGAKEKEKSVAKFVSGETPLLIMSLRSGAGLDGLQGSSHTLVYGELDWSWSMHEQCAGRLHRPGQRWPVVAYYLIANSGSDPIVADVLGVKRDQMIGVRDLTEELVEHIDLGADRVRKLASYYLNEGP